MKLDNNGIHLYQLKDNLISKAIYYHLNKDKNSVTINKYKFIPNQDIWDNIDLKDDIRQQEIEVSKLQTKIDDIEKLVLQAKNTKYKSQNYLDNNLSNYVDNKCKTPSLAPTPTPLFDSKDKSKNYALAYCSISFGCRVGVELARDKLDTAAKRFLASQSCTLMVRTYQKDNTLLDETMFNLLDAVSYAGCENESDGILSGMAKGGSCVMSAVTRLARVGQYIDCIGYKTEQFHNSYLDWKNAPQNKKLECDTHLDTVNNSPKIVDKHNADISKISDKQNKDKEQLEAYKNELKSTRLLRKNQLKLLNKLEKENQ